MSDESKVAALTLDSPEFDGHLLTPMRLHEETDVQDGKKDMQC